MSVRRNEWVWASGQTRVASYMLTKCQGLTRFPWLGYTAARHHDYTHRDGKAPGADGPFTLPPLPYDYADLEPHISAQIVKLHHDVRHAGYVKGANEALAKLDAIRRTGGDAIRDVRAATAPMETAANWVRRSPIALRCAAIRI